MGSPTGSASRKWLCSSYSRKGRVARKTAAAELVSVYWTPARPGSRWTCCREKTLSLLSVGRERFLRDLVRKWGPPWPIRAL